MDDFCLERVGINLISAKPRALQAAEITGLWEILEAIVEVWCPDSGPGRGAARAAKSRSSWLEFVRLRADSGEAPSYVGEYENALQVLETLNAAHGEQAMPMLLFAPKTVSAECRLGHAKKYVADEFMSVAIVSGGFRHFGGRNFAGYLGGSRFNAAGTICSPVQTPAGLDR